MRSFINYLRVIVEGADNRLSLRRVIAFIMVWLICHMIIVDELTTQVQLYALYSLELTMLGLVGIVTASNLIEFFKGKQDDSKK